jgi:hypothetical protein
VSLRCKSDAVAGLVGDSGREGVRRAKRCSVSKSVSIYRRSKITTEISGLFGMRQKKGRKGLDNIHESSRIQRDLLDEASPLLLFRRVIGEGGCEAVGSPGRKTGSCRRGGLQPHGRSRDRRFRRRQIN